MYILQDLFNKQLTTKEVLSYHTMLLSFKAVLAEDRKKIDVTSESFIKVNLPFKVQPSVDSWKKWAIQGEDGIQVVLAVFTRQGNILYPTLLCMG